MIWRWLIEVPNALKEKIRTATIESLELVGENLGDLNDGRPLGGTLELCVLREPSAGLKGLETFFREPFGDVTAEKYERVAGRKNDSVAIALGHGRTIASSYQLRCDDQMVYPGNATIWATVPALSDRTRVVILGAFSGIAWQGDEAVVLGTFSRLGWVPEEAQLADIAKTSNNRVALAVLGVAA